MPDFKHIFCKEVLRHRSWVDLDPLLHILQVRRSVEPDLPWESSPFAMRFQERVDEGTRATFSFCSWNVYDIETIDVVILGLQWACFKHQPRTGADTECPKSCNHSLTPIRLGVPFKLGIGSRPGTLLPPSGSVKLGLGFRRLLFRSAMALCFWLDDSQVCSYCSSYAVESFHLVNAIVLPNSTCLAVC